MEPRLPTVHSKRVLRVFSEAAARRRQIGRVDEGHGLGPTRRPLDQWQPQLVVDRSETRYSGTRAKLVEHAHIRPAMPMGQPRKLAPGSPFR